MRALATLLLSFLLGCGTDLGVYGERYGTALPAASGAALTVTFLGCTSLLFDDGETALMTDGFFTRPGRFAVLTDGLLEPDPEIVEQALARIGGSRLAVVTPVHSHFDHALDSPEVARQTGAVVLGSETTANIARGQGLPEEQIVVVEPGRAYSFGLFTVTLYVSAHAPIVDGGPPMPGTVDEPLPHPAKMSAFKEGGSYSIRISHPSGTALVQGSAGFVEGALSGVTADVVFLGTGGLAKLEEESPGYIERYWSEIVAVTGSRRVHPVHHDDFTLPFGSFRAFPSVIAGDLDDSLAPLAALATRDGVRFEMLPLLEAVALTGAP